MTAHLIRVTGTTPELLHPASCVRPCDEGEYERKYGLDRARWGSSDTPVIYAGGFDEAGNFWEELTESYDDVPDDDYHALLDATAGEVYDGPVRGDFRWHGALPGRSA